MPRFAEALKILGVFFPDIFSYIRQYFIFLFFFYIFRFEYLSSSLHIIYDINRKYRERDIMGMLFWTSFWNLNTNL